MIGDAFIQDGPRGLRFAAPTRVVVAMVYAPIANEV